MAAVYSVKTGDTLTAGLPSRMRCDEALAVGAAHRAGA